MAESTLDVLLRATRMGAGVYETERLDILETKKAFIDAQLDQIEAAKAAQKAIEASSAGEADAYEMQVVALKKVTEAQISQAEAAKAARDQTVTANAESAGSLDLLGAAASGAKLALSAVAVAGVSAGAAIGFGIDKAAGFEQQLTLIHTQAGAANENLQLIGNSLLQMAGEVGQGPTQLAEGLYHVESAGFRGAQALDMVRQAAELADVGQANLEDTTQAVIGTMAAFQGQGMTAASAVAQLNAIVGTGDMRMDQLDSAIATGILPTAATFGLTLKDVGAGLATITDNVTPADEAATRLRMTFALMGAPSGPARKALGALGIDALQLADDMRKPDGLLVAITDLKDHLSHIDVSQVSGGLDTVKADLQSFGLTDDEIQTALSKLGPTGAEQADLIARAFGGGRSSAAIMTLLTEFDRFSSKYQQIDDQSRRFQSDWEQQQATFSQGWNDFKAGLDSAAISFGQQFLPYATQFLGWARSALPSIEGAATVIGKDLVQGITTVAGWLQRAAPLAQQFSDTIGRETVKAFKDAQPQIERLGQQFQDLGDTMEATIKSEAFADVVAGLEVFLPSAVGVAVAQLNVLIDMFKIGATAAGGFGRVMWDLSQGDFKAAWVDMSSTVKVQTQNEQQLLRDHQTASDAITKATNGQMIQDYQSTRNEILATTQGMFQQMNNDALEDARNETALAYSIGANMDAGMAAGISANAGMVHTAASAAIRDALAGVQNENIIQSPSKKWADEVGLPLAQGIAMGLLSGQDSVLAAALGLTQPSASGSAGAGGYGGVAVPAAATGPISLASTITLMLDGQVLAQVIDQRIDARTSRLLTQS